jgi:hypothetical protein
MFASCLTVWTMRAAPQVCHHIKAGQSLPPRALARKAGQRAVKASGDRGDRPEVSRRCHSAASGGQKYSTAQNIFHHSIVSTFNNATPGAAAASY